MSFLVPLQAPLRLLLVRSVHTQEAVLPGR